MIKKNEVYDIKITGTADDGRGIGRVDGMAVFVPCVIIGEEVRVVIIKVLKNYAAAKLVKVLQPSAQRTVPDCDVYKRCGGCALRHMSYEAELEYKHRKVSDCIRRIGGIYDTEIDPIVPADNIKHYRNKSQFPVTPQGIGMYAEHSHRLIETPNCLIAHTDAEKIISAIRSWMRNFNMSAYDEKTHSGMIRNIYLRSGDSGTLVTIVTNDGKLGYEKQLVETLYNTGTKICGVIKNINTHRGNTLLGNESITLCGKSYIIDSLGDVKFKISPLSFYQVNKEQTKKLYQIAKDDLGDCGVNTLLDIYCGIGTIGQFMADKAKAVIGVESVPAAVADAKENAELNGIKNAKYICGKAEDVIADIIKSENYIDAAIIDPPRKGCDAGLLSALAEIKSLKKLVYISCKPSTLARDLKLLKQLGFIPLRITPVDMFPRTPHVETVVSMSRVRE